MVKNAQYVMLELMNMVFVRVVLVEIEFPGKWYDENH
jgi:hypothetical protein